MTKRRQIRAGQRYREWLGIVAELMQAAGMTQDDLAIRSQIDASNISRYFSGQKNPSIPSIAAISSAVGLDVELALRLTRVLPPKHHDPETETLFARAESALLGMSADERRIEVEALEHRARNAQRRKSAIIGKADPIPFSPAENGAVHVAPC